MAARSAEREAEHARERAQSRNLTDAEMARWISCVHELIAETIAAERERTTELLAELLAHIQRESAKKLREERRSLADETKALRIELCELQVVVGELRAALAAERGKPLDLPSPLSARRVN